MNTPAHAILNLAVLGREQRHHQAAPILAGAIVPDLPIVGFYAWQKMVVVLGASYALWQRYPSALARTPLVLVNAMYAAGWYMFYVA